MPGDSMYMSDKAELKLECAVHQWNAISQRCTVCGKSMFDEFIKKPMPTEENKNNEIREPVQEKLEWPVRRRNQT